MKFLFSVFFYIVIVSFLAATIINIPADQPTIQEGINVAVDGDTVLVQPDTYIENINYNGKNITVASLFLTTQNTAYILDSIIDGNNDNWRLVTFENGETEEAKLIGFTIKNGYCRYSLGIQSSSAKIKNNIIRNNDGAYYGGGIYVYQSESVVIENNLIDNHITQSGYGVAYGAGICINQSNNILTINNLIYNNTVDFGGGGSVAFLESSSDLINVIITDNSAGFGGGIFCYNSNLTLKNTTITDNSADWNGGGIRYDTNSTSVLINCILWNNSPHEIYFIVFRYSRWRSRNCNKQ
jgi:polygalacturonase